MRVLHTFNELRPSGAERMLACSGSLWAERGIEPIVLGMGREHPFADTLRAAGYRVELVGPARSAVGLAALAGAVVRLRPSAVHLHGESMFAQMTAVVRAAPSVRLVVRSIHSVFGLERSETYRRTRRRRLAVARALGMQTFAVSQAVAANELSAFGLQAEVVENWVDTHSFLHPDASSISAIRSSFEVPEGVLVLAVIGNCGQAKNHELLMRAAAESVVPVLLVHVGGEASMSAEEAYLASQLESRRRLVRLGPRGDVSEIMLASDAVAVPSRYEGFSLVAAEALCAGVPLLAARTPGLEWLDEFRSPRRLAADSRAWACAISDVADLRARQTQELDEDRRSALHRFSAERGVREWSEIYRRSGMPALMAN